MSDNNSLSMNLPEADLGRAKDIAEAAHRRALNSGKYDPAEAFQIGLIAFESAIIVGLRARSLEHFIARQITMSMKNFGPKPRLQGILNHMKTEIAEVEADPTALEEWVDLILLALDGAWRCGIDEDNYGHPPGFILRALEAKLKENERRQWPNWEDVPDDQPLEHIRGGEGYV